jgi:intein/homing endonuclease
MFTNQLSEQKAYILGFLSADGYVSKYGIEFQIQHRDLELLETMRDNFIELGYKAKIGKPRFLNGRRYDRLRVHSKELSTEITNFGIPTKKSRILRLPQIPMEYLFHFLRGNFDGDGSFTIRRNNLEMTFHSANKDFLLDISRILNIELGFSEKEPNLHCRCYRITYYSKEARRLSALLYEESKIHLSRKKFQANFKPTTSSKYWTEEQIQLLRANYPTVDTKSLCQLLNRNEKAIRLKALRLEIKKV